VKEKYDHFTWLGIATKAKMAGNFTKLKLTKIPFAHALTHFQADSTVLADKVAQPGGSISGPIREQRYFFG
jgi:hypothetical protein